jgi:hypothetical protein
MRCACAAAARMASQPGQIMPILPIGATPTGALYSRPNSVVFVATADTSSA